MLEVTPAPDSSFEEPRPVILLCENGHEAVRVLSGLPSEENAPRTACETLLGQTEARAIPREPSAPVPGPTRAEGTTRYQVRILREYRCEARLTVEVDCCASALELVRERLDEFTYRTLGPCARAPAIWVEPASERDFRVILSESEQGFWNDEIGWVADRAFASRYPDGRGGLPMSRDRDARYVRIKDAPTEFLSGGRGFTRAGRRSRWTGALRALRLRLHAPKWLRLLSRRVNSSAEPESR